MAFKRRELTPLYQGNASKPERRRAMASVLYAEVYLLCIIIVWLCRYWSSQRSSYSTSERWLGAMMTSFMVSFICNFLFTMFCRD